MIERMSVDSSVGDILRKSLSGERLSLEDGIRLFESDDVWAMAAAADVVRRRLNGNRTHYIVNRHVNHTDICCNNCAFCAYSRVPGDESGYTLSVEDVVRRASELWGTMQFTELHIVGGLNPALPFDYYVTLLRELRSRFPSVHLQAFTAVEIDHIARVGGLDVQDTLLQLLEAGLGSLPGGGAEVFSPRVREVLCPEKLSAQKWLDVMRTAHSLGIRSNATMLYGHIETYEERVRHIIELRALQDDTGGFLSFIPLKFHRENTRVPEPTAPLGALEDVKLYAVSRLMLDNIRHLKVFWIMLGPKLAQTLLGCGADDLDGTVIEEKITHRAGARTPQGLTVTDLCGLIVEAGFVPVERDTLYNEVKRSATGEFAVS